MAPTDYLLHLLGFVAPAAFLALLVPLLARGAFGRRPGLAWWVQVLVVFAAGVAVLAGGLWAFGRDGKMLTYGALVVAAAGVQWLAMRGWK